MRTAVVILALIAGAAAVARLATVGRPPLRVARARRFATPEGALFARLMEQQ